MKKSLVLLAGLALAATAAYAVPAKPGIRTFTQPDGTELQVELRGDEYGHFYVGADGRPMKLDADGYLRYVVADAQGRIALTANVAEAADTPAAYRALNNAAMAERTRMQAVDPATAAATVTANARAAAVGDPLPQKGMGLMNRQSFPTLGQIKSVVILVSYKDVDFTVSNPNDYYTRHLNEEGFSDYNAHGSCRDFFVENSMGQFQPQFDLYGPVKLSNNRSYYGADNANRHDVNAFRMVIEACAALDSSVDFSQYDLDGDGYIDNIYVIYAGQGQASYGGENTVWPHSSTITNGPVHDGVRVGRYATSNEWEYNRPDGIGTFVHEFSHVMGLPDLYETTYSTGSVTPGAWSVMDQGPYNGDGTCPPYYSAYERNALGWIDLKVVGEPESVDLAHIGTSNDAYIIQTAINTEFFLLENRMRTGWDAFLPGKGMLVWHIDYVPTVFNQNLVNNTPTHQYVDIVECNGEKGSPSGYAYPGTGLPRREISPAKNTLTPWLGPVVPHYITQIYERSVEGESNHITFLINGGTPALEAPVATDATALSATGFTANWSPVDGAASYALTVYAENAANQDDIEIGFGESTNTKVVLPEGWTFSGDASDNTYTTSSFCGKSKPALKFSNNGESLTSPLFEAEVNSVTFYLRASMAKAASMVTVEGRNDESEVWKTLDQVVDLTVANISGKTFSFDVAEKHVRQIRITFYGASGKMSIDDLALTFGDSYTGIYGEYNNYAVADGATSHTVAVAQGGPLKFTYTVKALTEAGAAGSASNSVAVDLTGYSGVTNITAGSDWSINANGLTAVYTGTAGASVAVYNAAGALVATATADTCGTAVIALPAAGLYIVSAPEGSAKIMAR